MESCFNAQSTKEVIPGRRERLEGEGGTGRETKKNDPGNGMAEKKKGEKIKANDHLPQKKSRH